jgi:hypothetical protein
MAARGKPAAHLLLHAAQSIGAAPRIFCTGMDTPAAPCAEQAALCRCRFLPAHRNLAEQQFDSSVRRFGRSAMPVAAFPRRSAA